MLGKTAGGQEDLWAGRVAGPLLLTGPRNNTQHTPHTTPHHTQNHTQNHPMAGAFLNCAPPSGHSLLLLLSSHASGGIVSRLFTSPAPSEGSHE